MSSRNFHIAAALLLFIIVILTAALYWPGLDGPFLLDDRQNIVRVYVPDFDWLEVLYAATHNTSGILGRPVSALSLIFSGIVHGPESWGYKYHNLALHLINGLLIFWLLLKLLPAMVPQIPREKAALIAGLTATVWLLHPLMVSTVLYAVQRMAQLSTFFTLVALLFFVFARINIGAGRIKFLVLAYLGFPLATMLAFLSKENGALIPFYVLACEMIVFGFRYENRTEQRRLLLFLGVFVILPVVLGSIYVFTHLDRLADYSLRTFTMTERLMTQLHVVAFYLKLILLPRLADMTLFHDYLGVTRELDLLTGFLLLLLVFAIVLVFFLRKRAPIISFAIAWFLISHLMESTFINLELVFEHRNYLAAAGPLLAVIYYLVHVPKYPQLRYVCGIYILLAVFLTVGRVQEWKSTPMLSQVAVMDHPESYRANTEFANLSFNSGNVSLALEHLDIAQELNHRDFGSVVHEIVYRCGRDENLKPLFDEATSRAAQYPVSPYALNSLDNLLGIYRRDMCPEVSLDEILVLVDTARGQEDTSNHMKYMGYLERIRGLVKILQGDYFQGARDLTKAYEYTGQAIILMDLINIQLQVGRLDDARQLLAYLERINRDSFGIETAKLVPLQEKLQELEAEKKMAVNNQ